MSITTSVFLPRAAQPGRMVRWAWLSSLEEVRTKVCRRHDGLTSVAQVRPKHQSLPPISTWLRFSLKLEIIQHPHPNTHPSRILLANCFCSLASLSPPPQVSGTTFVSRSPQCLTHGRHLLILVKMTMNQKASPPSP